LGVNRLASSIRSSWPIRSGIGGIEIWLSADVALVPDCWRPWSGAKPQPATSTITVTMEQNLNNEIYQLVGHEYHFPYRPAADSRGNIHDRQRGGLDHILAGSG